MAAALVSAALLAAGGCAGEGTGEAAGPGGNGGFQDFQQIQDDIFTPRCALAGCHTAVSRAGDLDLSTAAASRLGLVQIVSSCNAKVRVEPSHTDQSYLLDKVGSGDEPCGSMMPLGAPELSRENIDLIIGWIAAGAPAAGQGNGGGAGNLNTAGTGASSSTSTSTSIPSSSSSTSSTTGTATGE